MNANERGRENGHDSGIEFDAFEVRRGAYDDATVAQVVEDR